jgi:hypothetical protein
MITQLLLLTLFACPDPTTAADLGNPGPGGGQPGAAGGPNPGEGAPQGPPPAPGQFNVEAGTGVGISGTLSYEGSQEGQLRVDFLATEDDAPPRLLHVEKLDAFGAFTVATPPNTGSVAIVAFVDIDGDGPSPGDPAGMTRVSIGEANLTDVNIELSDTPDLGDLTPGTAGPAAAEIDGEVTPGEEPNPATENEPVEPPSEAEVPAPEAEVPAPEAEVPAPEAEVPAPEAEAPTEAAPPSEALPE